MNRVYIIMVVKRHRHGRVFFINVRSMDLRLVYGCYGYRCLDNGKGLKTVCTDRWLNSNFVDDSMMDLDGTCPSCG